MWFVDFEDFKFDSIYKISGKQMYFIFVQIMRIHQRILNNNIAKIQYNCQLVDLFICPQIVYVLPFLPTYLHARSRIHVKLSS